MGNWKLLRAGVVLLICSLVSGCITVNSPRPSQEDRVGPTAWGIMSKPNGCVIFREYGKTKVGFFVVAVTAKREGYLEVVESRGYHMPTSVWPQTQESMDELQRIATANVLRFVKIQDGYPPGELETARDMCEQENIRG